MKHKYLSFQTKFITDILRLLKEFQSIINTEELFEFSMKKSIEDGCTNRKIFILDNNGLKFF